MAEAKKVQRNFKPWDENEVRLDYAAQIGLNPGDVINESLKRVGKVVLQEMAKERVKMLRKVLTEPIP